MIVMDLKGITWVGHVYQRFEAMCLEAEEVMYQDTIKYVEDQVQTVSASVKKFYSDVMQDVMQDLLLPSSLEPVKAAAASNIAVEKSARTLKKPDVCLKEAAVKNEGKQLTDDSEVTSDVNENAALLPSSCQLHMVDNVFQSRPGSFTENAFSGFLSSEHNDRSILVKSNVENLPLAGTISESACVENDFSRMSSFHGNANANHEVSCQQTTTIITRVSVGEDDCDSIEESCNGIESASDSIPEILKDDLQLVESIGIKTETRCSSSEIESAESNGSYSNARTVSLVGCSLNGDIQHEELSQKIGVESRPGQSNTLTMDASGNLSNAVGRKGIETVRPFHKTGVDESCIMVDEAELHSHHPRQAKHQPYQKKITEALSSRMRLARKKEYEQLALWYVDNVKSNEDSEGSSVSARTREDDDDDDDMRRSLTDDVLDSEWELV